MMHVLNCPVDIGMSSSSSLAERRRIPPTEKLSLSTTDTLPAKVLQRLEDENARLPPQDSEEYMLAHLERQNAILNADPKSICIESNRLQADFSTLRNLISDATTFSPTTTSSGHDESTLFKVLKGEKAHEEEPDWDFWQTVVQDFPLTVQKLPHLLAAKLRSGVPHPLRAVIWQAMSQATSLNLESLYTSLCTEPSPYDRVISRDLSRTFPQLDMFKHDGGEGQLAMGRVLKAYSLYDAHVGYCQGLAFLVGPLLMTMPENQTFCVFVRLMETYEMRTMFTLNMEGLHLRLFQFQTLLARLCPTLDAHLTKHTIHTAMYASQWYLTLFAYAFPLSLVLRIYDLVFAEGAVETITRVAMALMQKNEKALLAMDDFEQLMMYLTSRRMYTDAYVGNNVDAVMTDAMALSTLITKKEMDTIASDYYKNMQQEKELVHHQLGLSTPTQKDLLATIALLKAENAQLKGQQQGEQQPSPVESVDGDHGFVHSLKMSGEFGSSIAGAFEPLSVKEKDNDKDGHDAITSELVSIKLANFEMGVKYQRLCQDHEQLQKTLASTHQGQLDLANKVMELQALIETLENEKEEVLTANDALLLENEQLVEKSLASKKTCNDLQLEKINVDRECQELEEKVKRLEEQRREYLMPRGSFTEEVFAAHQTLFGQTPPPAMSRRHTLQTLPNSFHDEYQTKYIESDLRCRELEKLLAETKFKLVEYETCNSSNASSPRASLQNRRPNSFVQSKRSSLSMLVKVPATSNGPYSPPYYDNNNNNNSSSRESTESMRSTASASSSAMQKRSSVYSRFLNALGTGPLAEEATELTEEPK